MSGTPLQTQVASSLGASAALRPHLNRLFEGISALGSRPATIARLLREEKLNKNSRVLDLACGKGAVAVELAHRYGCRVVGVDACREFVAEAGALAASRGVAGLCEFSLGDVRRYRAGRLFDAGMMIGLDAAEQAAKRLRRLVRAGGVYVVDDCVRVWPRHRCRALGCAEFPMCEEFTAAFEAMGDRVVRVDVPTPAEARREGNRVLGQLTASARAIALANPDMARPLRAFLASHKGARDLLCGPLRAAVWVVRRGK